MQNRYAAHDSFIRPAFGATAFWRVIVMIIAFETVFVASPQIFAAMLPSEGLRLQFFEGVTAFGTLAQFASFAIPLVGLGVLLRLLHGRGVMSLVGRAGRAKQDLIVVMIGVSFWLLLIEILPPRLDPGAVDMAHNFAVWLLLVPLTLVALLVQVATEELFFRGYLQQQFATLSRHPVVWMLIPSLMFGGLHYWNGQGPAEGLVWAVWATALGLACADLTARTGTIGAAVGLHLANNAAALLIVHVAGWPTSGVALFLYPYEDPAIYAGGLDTLLVAGAIIEMLGLALSVLIMWLAARIALRC